LRYFLRLIREGIQRFATMKQVMQPLHLLRWWMTDQDNQGRDESSGCERL
jgi:hypothetical protein